jgi:hypothetical protein
MLDLYEVTDLPKHAFQNRAVVVLGGFPDLAEPERAECPAVRLALPDLAPDLSDTDLRHRD